MKRAIRGGAIVLALSAAMAPSLARAQGAPEVAASSADAARARDLASRGRAAFDRGDLNAGCPLLDDAYRLDGQLLGAGFALAECREREGKLATARTLFLDVAAKAELRKEERAVEARARALALDARVARLKVDVARAAIERGSVEVTVDGRPWPQPLWGTAEPIDPGPHQVAASAAGEAPWSSQVDVAGEGTTVDVPVPFARGAVGDAPAKTDPTLPPESTSSGGFPWKTTGLVTGAVGTAILGTGVVLALVAKGNYDAVENQCDAANECELDAAETRSDARLLAHVGTALFVVGGVMAVGGVTVFLLAPDRGEPSAALRVGPATAAVEGRF